MKKFALGTAVSAAALVLGMQTALAADVICRNQCAPYAIKEAQSPWQIRVRALGVVPRDKASVKHAALGKLSNNGLEFSDTVIPELDITYYFTDNFAAELVLGTTYSHIGGKREIKGLGLNRIGKTWILPPTLTAQYHFTNFGAFKPYVGAGVNYTVFYNEKGNSYKEGSGHLGDLGDGRVSHLNVKNSFGGALQVGFDYMFDQHWGFNMDVKKLFLQPKYNARLDGARIHGKAKLDPWLIGVGITYRF